MYVQLVALNGASSVAAKLELTFDELDTLVCHELGAEHRRKQDEVRKWGKLDTQCVLWVLENTRAHEPSNWNGDE